jgi:hypothetical protein
VNIQSFSLLQNIGQMTPITNISMPSSTNVIMTSQSSNLTQTSGGKRQKQTDLSMSKPQSSTLVDLLKQRRSPPRLSVTNNSLSITARQQKQNAIVKKPSKKSLAQIKRLTANNDNTIRVNLNSFKLFSSFDFY